MMEKDDIKIGDVVELSSGGPPMTVEANGAEEEGDADGADVCCVWMVDGETPRRGWFGRNALRKRATQRDNARCVVAPESTPQPPAGSWRDVQPNVPTEMLDSPPGCAGIAFAAYLRSPEGHAEFDRLCAMRDGLTRLYEDVKRWLTESDDRTNLRAAASRIARLLGARDAEVTRCCPSSHEPRDTACRKFEISLNGRCVFCDHGKRCHPGPGATCEIGSGEVAAEGQEP